MKRFFIFLLINQICVVVIASTFKICGYIVDYTGKQLDHVLVSTANDQSTQTDSEGYYELYVNEGTHAVQVSKTGYLSTQKNIKTTNDFAICNFVMEAVTTLSGCVRLEKKGAYDFAGVYEYDNLTISADATLYSCSVSQIIINVKGTLTIEENASIWVRNGYYTKAPLMNIKEMTNSSIMSNNVSESTEYCLLPDTYGKGGNGGRGGAGGYGTTLTTYIGLTKYKNPGDGGNGGGGGGGGYGGGTNGMGGRYGSKGIVSYPDLTARGAYDGKPGGNGSSYGLAGGYGTNYTGLTKAAGGTGGDKSNIGSDGDDAPDECSGGGGGGNGGNGGAGGGVYRNPEQYGGTGGNGGGGGGGGYGGGVLVITANQIVMKGLGQHLFVSGQAGGAGGAGGYSRYESGVGGNDGVSGAGGLIIINCPNFESDESLWNVGLYESSREGMVGHGVITGNPQKVLYNISNPYSKSIIFGTLTDKDGVRVNNALVSLRANGGEVISTYTNGTGNFFISNNLYGKYSMTIEKSGFEKEERELVLNECLCYIDIALKSNNELNYSFDKETGLLKIIGNGKTIEKDKVDLAIGRKEDGSNLTLKKVDLSGAMEVTEIGNKAFSKCRELSEIVFSQKLSVIRNYAFSGCEKIAYLDFPSSLTDIDDEAFAGCVGLTTIRFNEGADFGKGVFDGCKSLSSIHLSASVTSANRMDFRFSSGLESFSSFVVEEENPFFKSEDGVLFDKKGTILIAYPISKKGREYGIPAGIVSIGEFSFATCNDLQRVLFSKDVTTVDEFAFYLCSELDSIVLPSKISLIRSGAFAGCTNLSSITYNGENEPTIEGFDDYPAFAAGSLNRKVYLSNASIGFNEESFGDKGTVTIVYSYCVTFDENGGDVEPDPMMVRVYSGEKIINQPTPTRTGYVFGGWFKEVACTNVWDFIIDKVEATTILYAKWTAIVKRGDSNEDAVVNRLDIENVVNFITGQPTPKFNFTASDINADNVINVSDVVGIVNIVLDSNQKLETIDTEDGKLSIAGGILSIVSDKPIRGFDLAYTGELDVTSELTDFYVKKYNSGALKRVIAYTMGNDINKGVLFTGIETISDYLFVDSGGSEINFSVVTGNEELENSKIQVFGNQSSLTIINAPEKSVIQIVGLSGVEMKQVTIETKRQTILVPKGIYIIKINNNSYKVVVG